MSYVPPGFLPVSEVIVRALCSRKTLYRAIARGELAAVMDGKGMLFVAEAAARQWAENRAKLTPVQPKKTRKR